VVNGGHLWNHKRPCQYLKVFAQSSWMILSKSFTFNVIRNRCIIHNFLHISWHGKVCSNILNNHLWMIITNLGTTMILKNVDYINCPTMCLLPTILWSQHLFWFQMWL
jgi:hypothetical protein